MQKCSVGVDLGLLLAQVDYEERELAAKHPEAFPPYRARVKKFIPFLF